MPKKVITRRQRKAAEAKRQLNEQERQNISDCSNNKIVSTPPNAVDAQPSCSIIKTESSSVGLDKSTSNSTTIKSPGADAGKTTPTFVLSDNKVQTENNVFESEGNKYITPKVDCGTASVPQIPTFLSNSRKSFSKALSRRAAATITKIQKLSKVFNRIQKFNYKLSPAKTNEETVLAVNLNEPKNDKNNTCNCELCKVVLSQLLTNKKRPNKKKSTKNSVRRQGNLQRRSVSPKQNYTTLSQLFNEKCGEDRSTPPIEKTRNCSMKKNEKLSEEDAMKKIIQINKIVTDISEQLQNNSSSQPNHLQSSSDKYKRKSSEPSSTAETTKLPPKVSSTKADYLNAIQQLSAEQSDTPPIKIIGNTGYFVLTGTNAQLATQLNDLANNNVSVQKCVLLEPDLTDNLEKQLEELSLNRDQILQKMFDKHGMLASRRKKRTKKSRNNN